MERTKTVKRIYDYLNDNCYYGGLPRAIDIYNYLSCNGQIKVTNEMIERYFN